MRKYYPDTSDEWDPDWPSPKGKPVTISIFVDADHASNTEDRRSISAMIIFIGSVPYRWFFKRQTSLEHSTFGAEFAAMRVAVEEAVSAVHTLRSIGVPANMPVRIFGDNKSVMDKSTLPGSVLKKKWLSIAYHKCQSNIANKLIQIYHIDGKENPAEFLTKSLPACEFRKILSSQCLDRDCAHLTV